MRRSCETRRIDAVATRAPMRNLVPRSGRPDPRIARVGTLQTRGEAQAVDVLTGEILGGVDRHVDATVAQRLLELAREDAAPADLRERTARIAVALGGERHDRDLVTELAQRGRRHVRLRHRQSRRARPDAERAQLARSSTRRPARTVSAACSPEAMQSGMPTPR